MATLSSDPLLAAVGALLTAAAARARSADARETLQHSSDRLVGPLRVALAGRIKAGKSTLLNALIGAELAASDAGECTLLPTWYSYAAEPSVALVDARGHRTPGRFIGTAQLRIDLGGRTDLDRVEVGWPADPLRDITFVDTPGLASLSAEVSARTLATLTPDGPAEPAVDAVVYLLRHTHSTDVRFLDAFGDDDLARSGPVNAVGVLSRADEIGSCRLDAMAVADRVARRYADEPRLRRICPVVVPVDGLLAAGAGALSAADLSALATLAAAEPADSAALLLTADRLLTLPTVIPINPAARQRLSDRIGLFGVRLAVQLLCAGSSRATLRGELIEASGLNRLREVLTQQFADRAALLKARSALALVSAVLDADGCDDADALRAQQERIVAGAHAFTEIRFLDLLQEEEIRLPDDQIGELERLFGAFGQEARVRLGVNETEDLRTAALGSLRSWRSRAEHPLSSRTGREAAAAAQRTIEGILVRTHGPE